MQHIFDDLSSSTIKMVIHQVVATEQLVYPWTSLVAEFGGCLGLFLGSSSSSGSSSSGRSSRSSIGSSSIITVLVSF